MPEPGAAGGTSGSRALLDQPVYRIPRAEGAFRPLVSVPIYQELLEGYLHWLRHYRHAADGTLEVRANSIRRFLQWLGPQATVQRLASLTCESIETFFLSYAQAMGQSARRSMQAALRTFLRFCLYQGYIEHPLDRAVATLRTYKLSTVPRALSEQQAQKIIDAVDCSTNTGRRDYAILQLLHTYGVRGGQVRALRLENIHWADNQIMFRASKNGKDSLLPLGLQVGKSLIDYLKQARPRCSYPQVFITFRAPYHPLARSSSLSVIVDRYIRAAGINLSSRGAHAFRHEFATRMVNKGYSLKAVADVLGYRHLSTTFIYTKGHYKNSSRRTDGRRHQREDRDEFLRSSRTKPRLFDKNPQRTPGSYPQPLRVHRTPKTRPARALWADPCHPAQTSRVQNHRSSQ